MEQLY